MKICVDHWNLMRDAARGTSVRVCDRLHTSSGVVMSDMDQGNGTGSPSAEKVTPAPKCPLDKKYGDIICRDGTLWALTYSEMAPPDSRQAWGDCPHCKRTPEPFDWLDGLNVGSIK